MTDEATTTAPAAGPDTTEPPVVGLLRDGVLDAELAALLSLLLEQRLPVIIAGRPGTVRDRLLRAMVAMLPAGVTTVTLAGEAEDFAWLPEAVELGWRRERPSMPLVAAQVAGMARTRLSPSSTVLLADLDDRSPDGTWGERARIAVRALAIGYGMAATMDAARLEGVLDRLAAPPVSTDGDERSRLGVVLVVGEAPGGRILAAHYVRPVVRDMHGHVQRPAPALLAARDARTGRLEHFAWGIVGELAGLTGRRPVDFEREQAARAGTLADLAARPVLDPPTS